MRFSRFRCLISAAVLTIAPLAQAAELTGAGASFPAPIYAKWADAYQKATGHRVNYQSIGSSGGMRQIRAKTVDFGGSDAPLKPEELAKDGLVQFPTVIGGVVPVLNVQGVKPGQLRLTCQVLGDIYLGKIAKWNDKAIADLNPGVTLPNQDIGVVRRSDGSGTTFIFTNYLSKVNAAGVYVNPDDVTFRAAAAAAEWSKSGFYEILTNQAGKEAWPITGATFILVHQSPDKPQQIVEVLKFFDWAFQNGGKMALELDYVPMPDNVVKLVRSAWASNIKDPSGKSLWAAAR